MPKTMDLSFCAFGVKTLLKHLSRMTRQAENVRDRASEDPEYVHQMRIASRRLRSALPVFETCFAPSDYQSWGREIKKITRALGEARDTDVQLLFLEDRIKSMPEDPCLPGIQRLHLRLYQKRKSLQEKVARGVDRFEKSGVAPSMIDHFRSILGKASLEKAPERSSSLFSVAAEMGRTCMADVISYDALIREPHNIRELHELRKSNKRLRYTLEFFSDLYEGKLDPFISQVREIHTLLGNIHDCDVWKEFLPLFLEEETRRTLEYYGHTRPMTRIRRGIRSLVEERTKTRDSLYAEFLCKWENMAERTFWNDLDRILEEGKDTEGTEISGKNIDTEKEKQ